MGDRIERVFDRAVGGALGGAAVVVAVPLLVIGALGCDLFAGGSGETIAPQTLQGSVVSVTGMAPVPQGTQCTVSVSPVTSGPFNCRVQVLCGGQIVYGGGQGGYTTCSTQAGTAGSGVRAQDTGMTPSDGDPSLDLHAGNNTAMVSDQGPTGMWTVNIALGTAGVAAAPTPTPTVPTPTVPTPTVPTPTVPTPTIPIPTVPGVPIPAGGAVSSWTGTSPLVCTGNDNMTVVGQTVALEGVTAITATGNCQLTLVGCTIRAQQVISASGNARVTIQGGRIEGTATSIGASGNAVVTVQGAEVVGRVSRSGAARIDGVD